MPTTRGPYLDGASFSVKEVRKGMISMPKVQSIRRRRMNGESIASIARSENVSEPTVRKYLKAGDLSPRPPVKRKHAESAVGPLRAGDSGVF